MPELSEAKRALLEKYLRGELPQTATATRDTRKQVEAEQTNQYEHVVVIKPTGTRRPFFYLHGQWKSQAFYCFPLAHGLGDDQPFYMLEPYGFDDLPVPPSFEEIAAAHIKSLRSVQPEGPYLLGGWCNGALMAYEMARQLHKAGQKVDLLVLMNPMALVYPTSYKILPGILKLLGKLGLRQDKQVDWYIRLYHLNKYRLHVISYLRIQYRRMRVALGVAHPEQIEHVRKVEQEGFTFPRLRSSIPRGDALRQAYESVFTWVTLGYKPSDLYPGKITFFWSSRDWTTEEPFHNGWREVEEKNEVEIHIFPGLHMSLVTEQLKLLTTCLRNCLNQVNDEEAEPPSTS